MMGAPPNPASRPPFQPQLSVEWESRRSTLRENLRVLFRRASAPHGTLPPLHFRYTLAGFHLPAARALVLSIAWHVAIAYFPFPGWPGETEDARTTAERYQLTYYGPLRDLPPLRAPGPSGRIVAPPEPARAVPRRGADAFHPRQTIVSMPRRPTHPRQTLIQPAAPQVAPKILPPLPNIVQWSEAPRPARPRLNIRAPVLGKARPHLKATAPAADLPLPAVPNLEKNIGELNIASSAPVNLKPRFAVTPMSVPQPGLRNAAGGAEPAPEIGAAVGNGNGGIHNLIALSAAPAPPAPVEIPEGNLEARVVISPEGAQTGVPGGIPGGAGAGGGGTGTGNETGAGTGAATAPPGISISGGNPNNSSAVAGLSPGLPARPVPARPLPAKPEPRLVPAEPGGVRPAPGFDRIQPGANAEEVLRQKRVYTMHVNMPNLSSATGSWVLRFAEMDERDALLPGAAAGDLSAPVPLRKVDPRYPPALVESRVEGEVVLYAIIRKDGSVDSIEVLRSVEPQLDRNAMDALARWKFRPAERGGAPVDLEAVVYIPFRFVPRAF